jgi:hypothetical protein
MIDVSPHSDNYLQQPLHYDEPTTNVIPKLLGRQEK